MLIVIIDYVKLKQTGENDPWSLTLPAVRSACPESQRADHSLDVPYSPLSTISLTALLEKIPKNKSKIALLIDSPGGCYDQAHIIAKKIEQIAKRNNAQVWTFAQEWAVNAGFLLLSTGDRVFVDHSSVIGGLEVGEAKLLKGKLGEYISTVTYAREPSYLSEMNKVDSFESLWLSYFHLPNDSSILWLKGEMLIT